MANKEMYDYLPTITPDYTAETLSVTPQTTLTSKGQKAQKQITMGDGSIRVITKSNQSYFDVTIQWDILDSEEQGTILDFYHNPAKANGMEKTFYWQHPHPNDGHTYVAQFMSELEDVFEHRLANYQKVSPIKLRITGRKVDA
jgi:hypothetical protein